MKITVYTINNCQFSKQEKEYLKTRNLQYEEKNLESDRQFLTEMLAVSNNFAGTPVTKIEKDDGQITVLKGFTLKEFDDVLGYSQPKTPAAPPVDGPTPTAASGPTPPPVTNNEPPTTSSQPPAANPQDPLNSVLQDLENKSQAPASPAPTANNQPTNTNPPPPATNPPFNLPNIPNFQDK